jgi:uncharacterized protein
MVTPIQPAVVATEPLRRRRVVVRWVRKIMVYVLIIYVAIVVFFALMQTWLIFPGRSSQGTPPSLVVAPIGAELVRFKTARGDTIVGVFGSALTPDGSAHPDPHSRPTIIDFYGNGMCLNAAIGGFDAFRRLGANLLIVEYAGYGMSEGSASEANCYASADAAYEFLSRRPEVDPKKIVAMGWSLGGAVAIDLAARKPVIGLVVYSTFTSMSDAALRHYPYLPAPLLLIHRFESKRKIARIRCPILIGHGKKDRTIPYAMSDRLAAAAGGPVTRFSVEDGDHDDFFAQNDRALLKTLGDFLDGLR